MLTVKAEVESVVGQDPDGNVFQVNMKASDRGAMFGLVGQQVLIAVLDPASAEPGYPKTLRGVYGAAIGQPDRPVNNHIEEANARAVGFTDDPQAIKIAGLS